MVVSRIYINELFDSDLFGEILQFDNVYSYVLDGWNHKLNLLRSSWGSNGTPKKQLQNTKPHEVRLDICFLWFTRWVTLPLDQILDRFAGKNCIPDHSYKNYGVENGTGISSLEVEHDTIVVLAELVLKVALLHFSYPTRWAPMIVINAVKELYINGLLYGYSNWCYSTPLRGVITLLITGRSAPWEYLFGFWRTNHGSEQILAQETNVLFLSWFFMPFMGSLWVPHTQIVVTVAKSRGIPPT